ncbi:MAG: serine hydrolase [Christensenellaceae bacterium]|nr:serine hydrolase [Christensenellaceae bacterium]
MRTHDIDALVKALPGHIGVYILDTVTGEEYAHQADDPIEAASVIKLTVMAEAFRQFEEGLQDPAAQVVIRPEDKLPSCGALTYLRDGTAVTLLDLVTLMIILSDNTATNLLIDRLGVENINAMIDGLGLTGTRLNRKLFMPELARQGIKNFVAARDMGLLLHGLMEGRVVSREASAAMLDILRNQRLNGKMPFFLHDKGIACAHKTGEDDGVTHDVGVIYVEHPIILCFLSEQTDVPRAERALQDIAAIAAGIG